ncbi:MAG: aminopeptidase [Candidatus Aenigmarchaeota archaeon ex4484_52]|nr:MAG: aminopeptidase [Candidatus Aenigmarchaeota archaeon ex4484_52]
MEKEKLSFWQKKEKELIYKRKNAWEKISDKEKKQIFDLVEQYKKFLGYAKTERLAVEFIENFAKQNNIKYFKNKEKAICLIKKGRMSIKNGVRIIASHIDSPHLDLKRIPIYEDSNLCFLKTHYYGGIKKYQWVNVPLSLIGVVIAKQSRKININIGEKENDSCFVISDLLPHLANKQMKKDAKEVITGEQLTAIAGNIPVDDDKISEKIKLYTLNILREKYDIAEKDIICSELQLVPSFAPRDIGFDKSLIGGYGQDDRLCAWASLNAIKNIQTPKYTSIVVFVDKEEIGSVGNTSADSYFFENIILELSKDEDITKQVKTRDIFKKSLCISSDVAMAIDPNYADVFEHQNDALLGSGVCIGKNTGWGGKFQGNDASAEYMSKIIELFEKNNIAWQSTTDGKIDEGGGGTISEYFSKFNMDVIDIGACILGMHSPFEISSKIDLYNLVKAHRVFLENL